MSTISALSARFDIPDHITFQQNHAGLVLAAVTNTYATASIALQGAHLMTWTPRTESPVIWLSPDSKLIPGKAIRGGVPVCWPWFGPHTSAATFPSHGIARTALWDVIKTKQQEDGTTLLIFRLIPDTAARAFWPYASEVDLHMVVGTALELELVTRNTSNEPFTLGTALHSYFAVSDITQASIDGLDGCSYIDKTKGGLRERQSGPVVINAETDRIYLNASADCFIDDPGLKRRIRIEKRGSHSSVVWNPWREKAATLGDMGEEGYRHVLCLESGNVAEDQRLVAPGSEHRLWVRYSVEKY